MGEGKLQKFVFTLLMCFFMVLGMTMYNIVLHAGWSSQVFLILAKEFWLVFIIALFLDTLVIGPLGKKLAFTIIPPGQEKHIIFRILSIALPMVTGMVLCMSVFGALTHHGFTHHAFRAYPGVVRRNFIMALPLNLLIVAPLARALFPLIFPQVKNHP